MRVVGIGGSAIGSAATRRRLSDRHEPDAPEANRALIAVHAPRAGERLFTASRRPAAPFLAQLIATHMQAPQTRVRRRAEPEEAMAAYRASQATPRLATGAIQREA
jgi:hypothetical protein